MRKQSRGILSPDIPASQKHCQDPVIFRISVKIFSRGMFRIQERMCLRSVPDKLEILKSRGSPAHASVSAWESTPKNEQRLGPPTA